MDVNIHGSPIYFSLWGIPITSSLLVTWVIMLLLTGFCIWLTHGLKVKNVSKRQAIAEWLVNTADHFVLDNMGEKFRGYIPLISALFTLSILSSLSSLVGAYPPTADISTTLAWALLIFVLITFNKIKYNHIGGYLKSFCEPVIVMAPLNVLSEFATPLSLAFRHFGNIVSGYVISTLIYAAMLVANRALFGLLFGWISKALASLLGAIPFLGFGVPAVFSLYFDWFSSFMQAFIFCMLSMVYISSAAEE